MFDLDKVRVPYSAIWCHMGPQVAVEELVLREHWRDVGDGERSVVAMPELDSGGSLDAARSTVGVLAAGP